MQELIHEKRKISSTPVIPGTNPEWFVVDAPGNFYGVTGYGDAFGAATMYEITPQINLSWGGGFPWRDLVRHC
jgi:hypothetical protein